jgi:hypothetical protein
MDTIEIAKPVIEIVEKSAKKELLQNVNEEGQVIVHCSFTAPTNESQLLRIWRTTFLCSNQSAHRSRLAYIENISIAPAWTMIEAGTTLNFTLVFSGLPKSCKSFDFKEEITQPGGFFIKNIARNKSDVYRLVIS